MAEMVQEIGFATQGSKLNMEKAKVVETRVQVRNGSGRKPLKKLRK